MRRQARRGVSALTYALGACVVLALLHSVHASRAEPEKDKPKGDASSKPSDNASATNSNKTSSASDNTTEKRKPPQSNPADLYKGNVKVARILEASVVLADAFICKQFTALGDMKIDKTLTAGSIKAKSADINFLKTDYIIPKSGRIQVDGDLLLVNSRMIEEPKVNAVSFIAEDVVIGGVKQWKLVRHENFEGANAAAGWSLAEVSSCTGRDHFLGGHCKIADGEAKKVFDNLPPHSQVRLTARYHMIDDWQGQTAFLKLDEHFSWADHSRPSSAQHGINMCGAEHLPERRMSIPIDVTLQHDASFIEVAFGSTRLDKSKAEDPCQRSFGVDDVMLYVR